MGEGHIDLFAPPVVPGNRTVKGSKHECLQFDTGRVDLSGANDLTKFVADELCEDAFWIIKLNK